MINNVFTSANQTGFRKSVITVTQPAFTCSKLEMETSKQCMKSV